MTTKKKKKKLLCKYNNIYVCVCMRASSYKYFKKKSTNQ